MSYRASIRPNVVVPFHRWTTCGPRQLHTKFGPNIRTTSIPAGPLSFMFSHFTIQNFILQFEQRPPPSLAVHSIKLIIDTTQFFPFEGRPSSVRGSHTPNLVQIFKGLVTLYAFSPFQFTIRHTIAPCLIEPSIRPNVVVPFHRWTTCGPRQLHTKFGPNIRTTSIPAGPLSFMFSRFTIQNFRLQFDPPPSRSTQ